MKRAWLRWMSVLSLGALFVTGNALAQAPVTVSPETLRAERRVKLVKLWGDVRFRHPRAFSMPAEWDAAFLSALPKVEAAGDSAAYAAAVQGMLATLGDGATRVESEKRPDAGQPPTLRALKSWEKDVLVLDLRNLLGPQGSTSLQELRTTLDADAAKARAVVLDLRMRGLKRYGLAWMVASLLPHLVDGELRVPGLRDVRHSGLRPQGEMQGFYGSEFRIPTDDVVTGTPGKKPALLVFLVDTDSAIDQPVLALRARGKALLVAEGPLDDGAMNNQDTLPLGEGYNALLSVDEPVLPLEADVSRPARVRLEGPDEGMRQALLLASRPPPKPKASAALPRPALPWRPEPTYKEALYPSRELRLLAGAKLWTVVRFFFAYRELMDRPWDSRLPGLLEKLEAAKDAKAYVLALAEATTWLQDAHAMVRGHPELQRFYGAIPPVWVTDLDGKAVVVEVHEAASSSGLVPGDIIEKVDGEPIDALARRFAPYVAASLASYHRDLTLQIALGGEVGSTAVLGVRGAKGPKEAKLVRTSRRNLPPSKAESYRLLEGNLGFVDLGKLEVQDVPAMFEKLKDTRGIVFDLRAYPRGTMWALGPYFDVKGSRPFAWYMRPYAGGQNVGWVKYVDSLRETDLPKYRGRTVTLIDSRTISQAEHTGLLLKAAADTVFVGSATAGTNGDVTEAILPGDISFYFTGQQVLHGDGRQLQRKGLEPDVKLRPTVAGLQAGRDELLERALQILRAEPPNKPASSSR
ncbi:peptidase S41 [Myxococcus llanfairpwllgwyngyllgogerychwyrndrobwllllantysiliogogogochensis]|uniref:Peptidase S41 n=1 Tax=Myxococcus llanfairpwllgwyngyllgogerychwyrndrobwllllantysiliogogogochensis TaxID=2590453 RepID=A0A540X8F9_9BACT|nr:S41 family peptidase [Myxococcus llanfairpwllgwyngyllgogerychwyrndrobwllllantysiliogogogochensis]TQF17527.1 peptidase S41 [Myxococcus llanfairpwllgwyngyllgogerychwyrndrobwllllantysiliogogogochensis]